MKQKSRKVFILGLSFVLGVSMLVGCSSGSGKGTSSNKNTIAIKDKYVVNGKDGKYGLMDFDKKQVIPFEYDYFGYMASVDLFIASKGGKYGVIDIDEKEIIPFEYEDISISIAKDKFYASDYKITTVFNLDGKKEKSLNYGTVWDTGEGSAIVGKETKIVDNRLSGIFGLIDASGNEILKPEYNTMYCISEYDENTKKTKYMSIYAEKDGKAGIFSLKGDVIIPMEYEGSEKIDTWNNIFHISYNGYTQSYFVNNNEKYGTFDKSGKQILETKYDSIEGSHNGYIASEGTEPTVFDLDGNKVFSDASLEVNGLSDNGWISVRKKEKYLTEDSSYYVDATGNKVEIEGLKDKGIIYNLGTFDSLGNASISYSVSDNDELALINEKGETLIGPFKEDEHTMLSINKVGEYSENEYFSNAYSMVSNQGRDSTNYMLELRKPNENNLYQIVKSTLYDKTGKKIIEYDGGIEDSLDSDNLYLIYKVDGENWLFGLIDKNGEIVAEPIYDNISNYYDDYLRASKDDMNYLLDRNTGKIIVEY